MCPDGLHGKSSLFIDHVIDLDAWKTLTSLRPSKMSEDNRWPQADLTEAIAAPGSR